MQRKKHITSQNGNICCSAVVKALTLYAFFRVLDCYLHFGAVMQNKHLKISCSLCMPLCSVLMGNT